MPNANYFELEDLNPFSFVYKRLSWKELLTRERGFICQNEADGPLFARTTSIFELITPKLTLPPSFINFPSGGPFPPSPPGLVDAAFLFPLGVALMSLCSFTDCSQHSYFLLSNSLPLSIISKGHNQQAQLTGPNMYRLYKSLVLSQHSNKATGV